MVNVICKGSWGLGTACGKCTRCINEALDLIPTVLEQNHQMKALLEIINNELLEKGRLVSNPVLIQRAIAIVLKGEILQ